MIKVSFIALVLAAIGYKEYNPSVLGNWEIGNSKVTLTEDGQCITYEVRQSKGTNLIYYTDTSSYTVKNGIFKANLDRAKERSYSIHRQNKRKLILRRYDIENGEKIIYKRIK
jgi:hypothetical protein